MTLRANGSLGLSPRQSGCSGNLTRATGHPERPPIVPIRMIRSTWNLYTYMYIDTPESRSRESPMTPGSDCVLRDRFAPAFTCTRHISVVVIPHECKKVKCGRELETSSGSTHVGRRWSSASLCPSKSCTNAYQVSLSEFCDNDDALCWSEKKNLTGDINKL